MRSRILAPNSIISAEVDTAGTVAYSDRWRQAEQRFQVPAGSTTISSNLFTGT